MYCNFVFTAIYVVEMGLKLIAQGRDFLRSKLNIFDSIIVVAAIVDVILDFVGSNDPFAQVAATIVLAVALVI